MVVCLCKGVSDKKIRWLVQNGSTSVREVMATSQAGKDCGTCICEVKKLVDDTKAQSTGGDEGMVGS